MTLRSTCIALAAAALATGCASWWAPAPPNATVFGAIGGNRLVSFNAATPTQFLANVAITGLGAGENVVGMDFRPADGRLYALTSAGRLYTIDRASGAATRVGTADANAQTKGVEFGMDFNPTVDRIRFVGNAGENMRVHPDTGAVIDANPNQDGIQIDGVLAYAEGDVNAGRRPFVSSAAYTNSVAGAKTTTNYVIDAATGVLATQGSREGVEPAVSPNTGRLFTVGPLGVQLSSSVQFDIAPGSNAALVAGTPTGGLPTLYSLDLRSGRLHRIGLIGDASSALRAMAIAP